ncbi:hypothetical protein OKHIL_65870 [Mycolicibacterium mageritense]
MDGFGLGAVQPLDQHHAVDVSGPRRAGDLGAAFAVAHQGDLPGPCRCHVREQPVGGVTRCVPLQHHDRELVVAGKFRGALPERGRQFNLPAIGRRRVAAAVGHVERDTTRLVRVSDGDAAVAVRIEPEHQHARRGRLPGLLRQRRGGAGQLMDDVGHRVDYPARSSARGDPTRPLRQPFHFHEDDGFCVTAILDGVFGACGP